MFSQVFIDYAKMYYEDPTHPLAVASKFDVLSDEWVVALFHDILEDTDVQESDLYAVLALYGKEHTFSEIVSITRKDNETYFDYIRRLREEEGVAMRVKIVDLQHNLSRFATLRLSLMKRYEKALKIFAA